MNIKNIVFKKILLALFLFVLIAVPTAKVRATQVYVGIAISALQGPGGVQSAMCLPIGTTIGITDLSGNYIAAVIGSNPVTTSTPVCAGTTVWSSLLDLTAGSSGSNNYRVKVITPNFCSGVIENGICWESWTGGKNCCDICAHYGQIAYGTGSYEDCKINTCYDYYGGSNNCSVEGVLKGSACSSCVSSGTGTGAFAYYNNSSGVCTYSGFQTWRDCTYSDPDNSRVCACNYTYGQTAFPLIPWTYGE